MTLSVYVSYLYGLLYPIRRKKAVMLHKESTFQSPHNNDIYMEAQNATDIKQQKGMNSIGMHGYAV